MLWTIAVVLLVLWVLGLVSSYTLGWIDSCPAGCRAHRVPDSSHSGSARGMNLTVCGRRSASQSAPAARVSGAAFAPFRALPRATRPGFRGF